MVQENMVKLRTIVLASEQSLLFVSLELRCFIVILALCIVATSSLLSTEYGSQKVFRLTALHNLHDGLSFVQSSIKSNGICTFNKRNFRAEKLTALPMVWWFGGSENADERTDDDSCELVAVRIERTSSNSRRILGEITIPNVPMDAVWSILTDYDNLAVHVPNLVESKIVQRGVNGRPGDGQYQCRLYQKGAQKIIGFEFGASVTMDMKEYVLFSPNQMIDYRKISFKCYDSFFFQEFDGEWKVYERPSSWMPFSNGDLEKVKNVESVLSYAVDVRPKGPVPVAALEWRIREDVPTNLRAVKKAAQQYEMNRQRQTQQANSVSNRDGGYPMTIYGKSEFQNRPAYSRVNLARDARLKVQWYKDETMEAYLSDPQ